MSSNKKMTNAADNDVVEQPGGGRELICTADDRSQFLGTTATNDLGPMGRDVALRSGAAPTDQWSVQYNNMSRMVSRGKIPPMPRPALSMILSGPTTPRASPQNVQGQVPGPRRPRGRGQAARRPGPQPLQGLAPRPIQGPGQQPLQGPAPQPPQRQDAQRPQQKRARGRGSRGANRGGVQKSGRQETSSSARGLQAKIERDPEFRKEVEELARRKEQETSRAALERSKKATACGNCGKPGHTVRDCVHPADDGFVHGCPICNGSDHESAQGCKLQWPRRLERRLHWAIELRAHRPTLAAFPDWADLFMEARNAGNVALPQSFPWTPSFCHRLMAGQEHPWSNFDYVANNWSALPVDGTTRDQDTVIRHNVSVRGLSDMVVGSTGGSPWYPRQEEKTDVTMGEAAAPVAQVEDPDNRSGSVSRAESLSRAESPVMSRAGSPSLTLQGQAKPSDDYEINWTD